MNLLDAGSQWLGAQLREHGARQVVYRRGGAVATLPAVLGQTRAEQELSEGRVVETTLRDFIIAAADLVLDGQQREPARDDVIVDGGQRYRVTAPGAEQPWRYTDGYRLRYRIHTTHLGPDG